MSEHLLEEDELLLYEEIFEREYGWLVPSRTRNPLFLVLGTRHLLVSEELWVPSLPFVYVISKIFAYGRTKTEEVLKTNSLERTILFLSEEEDFSPIPTADFLSRVSENPWYFELKKEEKKKLKTSIESHIRENLKIFACSEVEKKRIDRKTNFGEEILAILFAYEHLSLSLWDVVFDGTDTSILEDFDYDDLKDIDQVFWWSEDCFTEEKMMEWWEEEKLKMV